MCDARVLTKYGSSDGRKLRLDLEGCLDPRDFGAGTRPFAVPRLRSLVHDNVHRYDDIQSLGICTRGVLIKFVRVSTLID